MTILALAFTVLLDGHPVSDAGSTNVIPNVLESEPISVYGRLLGTRSSITLD